MRLLNQYLRDTFGCKVYKIAIDAGFTCPNRDGTIGTGAKADASVKNSGAKGVLEETLRRLYVIHHRKIMN